MPDIETIFFSTLAVMPSGILKLISWLYPRDKTSVLPFTFALYPVPTSSNFFSNPCEFPTISFFTLAYTVPSNALLSPEK